MTGPGLWVMNFGGPKGPEELTPFLTELLQDVLPGPMALKRWVAPALARSRSKKVSPNYESIGWSPIVATHDLQVAALVKELGADAPERITSGMMFTAPTMKQSVKDLQGCPWIIALPMFPHYSIATTQTAFSFAWQAMVEAGMQDTPVHWIPAYFDHPLYIDALCATIRKGIAATPGEGPIHLVFSPHGLPLSFVHRGDPYPDQVRESVRRAVAQLGWSDPWTLGWQSRVGPVAWLEPSTETMLQRIGAAGGTRVCIVPISFVSEHIETLYEIDVEYREVAEKAGIHHFARAPALGLEPAFLACLADLVRKAVAKTQHLCVRCLHPQSEQHRRRAGCATCRFTTPAFLRDGVAP